jgi:hypothetical protein
MNENMGYFWGGLFVGLNHGIFEKNLKLRVTGYELKREIIPMITRNPEHATQPNSIYQEPMVSSCPHFY